MLTSLDLLVMSKIEMLFITKEEAIMTYMKKNIYIICYSYFAIFLLLISQISFAGDVKPQVVIGPNTIINTSTTYSNTTLDLTNGSFVVTNNATLTIDNCTIIGTLSSANPTLITVAQGNIVLTSNIVQVSAVGIVQHPLTESIYYALRLNQAQATLTGNNFTIDQPFSAGLLITSVTTPTNNINITNNTIANFHGVFYLLNSANTIIDSNLFKLNSYGNIVLVGDNSTINNNKIIFAGRDRLGNAMDIIDSTDVNITNNVLFTSTCRGIYVVLSQNVLIDSNSITGGITYAMILLSTSIATDKDNYAVNLIKKLGRKNLKNTGTQNITVTNNVMSQNRYGIAATDVDHLTVEGNYFSQRFNDNKSRMFWTNNAVLFKNVTNLIWTDNVYKEAFTQVNGGDNSMSQFVTEPVKYFV